MKKSQAIQMVANMLNEYTDFKYLDCPNTFLANQIITMLEESGMKPPVVFTDPVLLTYRYEWERE